MKSWGWFVIGGYLIITWNLVVIPSFSVKKQKELPVVTKVKETRNKIAKYAQNIKNTVEKELTPVNVAKAETAIVKNKPQKRQLIEKRITKREEVKNSFEIISVGE